MKHLLFLLFLFLGMNIAKANTLTGKINLPSGFNGIAKVCMNGTCGLVSSNGSYSLEVTTDAISSKATTVNSLRREGSILYASGAVQVVNLQGATVLSGNDRLDLTSLPSGQYVAINGHHAMKINTTMGRQVSFVSSSVSNGVSARSQDAILGNAYIIVNGDTLREIKVTSWNLPTNYMVARSHAMKVKTRDSSLTSEIVFWSNDSIAYVVGAPTNKTKMYRSAFVYTLYDSTDYMNGNVSYQYFNRLCKGDTIKKYTDVYSIPAGLGNPDNIDTTDWKTVSDTSKSIYTVISHDTVFPSVLTTTAKNIMPSHWILADSVLNLFDSLGAYDDTIYNNTIVSVYDSTIKATIQDTVFAVYHVTLYGIQGIDSTKWKVDGYSYKMSLSDNVSKKLVKIEMGFLNGLDTCNGQKDIVSDIGSIASKYMYMAPNLNKYIRYIAKTTLDAKESWKNATITHVDSKAYILKDAALLKH